MNTYLLTCGGVGLCHCSFHRGHFVPLHPVNRLRTFPSSSLYIPVIQTMQSGLCDPTARYAWRIPQPVLPAVKHTHGLKNASVHMRPHHSQVRNSWRVGVGVGGVILTGWVQGAKAVTTFSSKYELCCVCRYLFCCFYRAVGTAVFAWGVCLAKWRWRHTWRPTPTYPHTEELIVSLLPIEMIIGEKKSCLKKYFNLSQFLLAVFFIEWNHSPLNLSFISFLSSLTKVSKA